MALFYNQADQDIYTGGDHFIPQEQYRLGNFNMAPPSIANAPNTGGITNTNAAIPYMGYPSYAAYLAAQGVGGGGGGDEEDGPSYGNMIGKGPLHGVPPQSIFSRLQNIPTPLNLARRGITWGLDKFGEWNEARKEKAKEDARRDAGYDESGGWSSPTGRDHAGTGGIGSPESGQGGAPGTPGGEGGFKGAHGGRVRFFYGGLASIL